MSTKHPYKKFPTRGALVVAATLGLLGACSTPPQKTFDSPDHAVQAVVAACKADDVATLLSIFGEDHPELVVTDDPAADRENRKDFAERAGRRVRFANLAEDRVEIIVGENEWPSPIPLVATDGKWRFDTAAGIEEILNRRVGRNELAAIALCKGYLDAQHIYQNRDWDEDGFRSYARRIKASPGKFDGLYWPTDDPTKVPLCPLAGFIHSHQDYFDHREEGTPWRGYRGRVLTSQGTHAEGGAMNYLVEGRMVNGFGLVLWPDDYGHSGIMTFIVNHRGRIFQKDMGRSTRRLVDSIQSFNPDDTWTEVED